MLNKVTDISSERELEEYKKVLDKCSDCICIATLKQITKGVGSIDLQDIHCEVTAIPYMDNDYVRLVLQPNRKGGMADLKRIRSIWKTALSRNTSRMLDNKEPDYSFQIELAKTENRTLTTATGETVPSSDVITYLLSFHNPITITMEDDEFLAVFDFDNAIYGIEGIDSGEIEYIIRLDEEREASETAGVADEVPDDDNNEFTDNDELLGIVR